MSNYIALLSIFNILLLMLELLCALSLVQFAAYLKEMWVNCLAQKEPGGSSSLC